VDVLVSGERGELLDARLDVVPGDALPRRDAGEVHVVEHPLVRLDDAVRDVDAEVALGPQHRQPQAALGADLLLWRPDGRHLGRRVPGGQDVRDHPPILPEPPVDLGRSVVS